MRAARDHSYRAHWAERFAHGLPQGPFDLWIHAVSVGETHAAAPIVNALLERTPTLKILLTHMTPTGRTAGESLFEKRVVQCYLPYDTAPQVRRFLDRVQPARGIIMETELWPELLVQARARKIPVWLVNARLSQKSARGYAKFPALTMRAFGALTGVLAQSAADGARFSALGAHSVRVVGNVKFDVAVPGNLAAHAQTLRAALGNGPLWVAGSTRAGDEKLLLTALQKHPLRQRARVVIVPRHPQRFEEVAALASAMGFRVAKRSVGDVANDTEVVIGDSMGEMFGYYACADVVFMGGSFATGSQNLIEPCAAGCPVVLGPSTFNFAAAARAALDCGAAVQVADGATAVDAILQLLDDSAGREIMRTNALKFAQQNQGATYAIVSTIFDHNAR